ncbi:conserved hypothetical protein [Leishmania major strain Friedlin]|uniref:Uncharacterized protein L3377.1L n=1 Tax=Leishmania major TaxID=5664 RepID=Q9GRP7_LEIMA|nr:conserved hypothetical protein [Leishmania major strain Friedlin]CAC14236.1 hypothetical protein L7845.04 [Leishmania major]CAG9582484.1 hypothetical_protein_-_conserved [Leishmania major strain Friedlin]CBZ12759.1 conserved hypothetical protein [Leishmania major strain Friedlin]|eukprot:XP_003722525.1 conserved hypothetical protein [Leishmania major strain Friedlin]
MATTTATDVNAVHHAPPPTPPPSQEIPASALALDRKVVQALFVSLRMSIPHDVQRRLLCNAAEELEFLIARQPRVSAFHHRRRESLRHPALAMAAKKYYRECRRRRFELELQQMVVVEGRPLSQSTSSPAAQVRSGVSAAQRESVLVDLLFSEYAQQSSIYSKDQDRQGDHYGTSTGNGAAGFGGFAASHTSTLLNTYAGSTPPRLLGRISREADSETRLQSPTTPRGGHAVELSSTMASGKSGILVRRSATLRHPKSSNEDSVSALSEALNTGSLSRFAFSVSAAENAENGGSARARGVGVGVSTAAAADGTRFFARRMGCNDNAAVRRGGGSGGSGGGAGDKFASGWTGEMRVLLQRRMEEEREAGTGNDPYLFISARPVEHLLCCYGGVSREPAAMALGAASMLLQCDSTNTADADPFRNAIVEEDMRWDQLAGCHRQLLRAAYGPCRAAAAAVADDHLVNDVIRRFWDRLTVSMAAQHAHKAQEARKSRAAADADIAAAVSALRGRRDAEADEDDLNEISDSDDKDEGVAVGRGAGTGDDDVGRRKAADISLRRAKPSASKSSRTRKTVSKLSRKKKKGCSAVSSGVGGGSEQHSSVAYYMTPLQYVYLHTRIAHVLLPECDAVEVELLPYIQEDLLVDAAYDEGDAAQPFYFGEAPRLVGDFGRQNRRSTAAVGAGPMLRASLADSKLQGVGYEDAGDDRMSATGVETQRDALHLQRRFLSVRRNGYGLSRSTGGGTSDGGGMREIGLGEDGMSIGPASSMAVTIDDGTVMRRADGCDRGVGRSYAMASLSLVPMSFTVAQLPSLTYPQFWCSMMELADNWTCCAGNPVETAIFMWELYAEVFGHNWDEEDKLLASAVESRAAKSAMSAAEKEKLAKVEAETMESFQALLREVSGQLSQPPSRCRSLNSITSITEAIQAAADRYRSRRLQSETKRDMHICSQSTQSIDTDDDELLLLASYLDLSLSELKRLAEAKAEGNDRWVYSERVGEDGVTRRYRRRVCDGESHSSSRSISGLGSRNGSYILEEELDKDGAVVSRRKLRWNVALLSDGSLYTADERAPGFLRRKYYEDRPKKLRHLESWRRVSAGHSGSNSRSSSMTSWSSIDDCDSDDRRNRRRRRRRTRHTGLRRDHPRYSRKDDRYGDKKFGLMLNWRFPSEDDVADGGDGGPRAQGSSKSGLNQEEREHLLARKEWLCSVLEAQGIHLPPHMLEDPAEQMLLYDFLRLAEERERAGDQSNYRGGSDDDYHLEDGEAGDTDNLSRLAGLVAKLQGFTLDDLANSSLMRRLLGESEAEGAVNRHLTPQQVQDILTALTKGQRAGGARADAGRAEQESVRERRLRLLRMLEENRALQQQRREDSAASGPKESPLTKETFDLTEVPQPPPRPLPSKEPPKPASPTNLPKRIASPHPPSAQSPPSFAKSGSPIGFSCASLDLPERQKASSRESSAVSSARLLANPIAWKISPTTLAERKELERLFRELEAYWADRASQGGRFRVDIVDYTPEQLEEFFAHLHLGPRQRALLRGRAPLAAATSLVGGAMHQDGSCLAFKAAVAAPAQQQHGHAGCGQPAHSLVPSPTPLAPAPVKLFTLTTEGSLDGALRRSYQSYMEDKLFSEALHGNVKLDTARPARVSTAAQSLRPPPLPRLKLRDSRWRASGERAGGVPTTSAAPRPPPKSSPPSSSLPRL